MDPDNAVRLQWMIERRRSSRAPFDPAWPVTDAELGRIVDAARWAPTAHNMQNYRLIAIDDPAVLAALGRIETRVSPTLVAESAPYLAASRDELAARGYGLLAAGFPVAGELRTLGSLIAGAPLVVVVAFDSRARAPASENDFLGAISLGCVLENMWLAAHAAHLDAQVLSALADAPGVHEVLGIPAPWRVAFALRLGHARESPVPPRARRHLADIVGRNRF